MQKPLRLSYIQKAMKSKLKKKQCNVMYFQVTNDITKMEVITILLGFMQTCKPIIVFFLFRSGI